MKLDEFKASLNQDSPPGELDKLLQALWYDANGDWDQAHRIAQAVDNADGAWIHAYLHRKEGDTSNASYWYSRAGKNMPNTSLDDEWEIIVGNLLG